ESDARDGSHFLSFEQLGAEVGRLQSGAADVREKIERALSVHARDAGNGVEFPPRIRATLIILREPVFEMVLRPIESGNAALLCKARRITRAVRLNRVNGLGNRFGR